VSGSGSIGGRSPSNLCTAMKPAWTSSSGSLPDGFRIRLQRDTFRRLASSLWKTKVAHYPKMDQRAAEMKAKYTTSGGAKPVAHPLCHDATVARLMQILDGKAHVALEPPDGMLPGEYMARLMETLRRRKDTSGHSWQCRNIGGRIVVKCNGPVGRAQSPQDGPVTGQLPEAAESTGVATGPNVALPAADLTDVHEFGLDIRHSPAAVALVLEPIEIPSDPAMHEKRAAFVEALPAVALALESQEAPTASPGADVARPVGQISDLLPEDPPEAAELVNLMIEYHITGVDGEGAAWERNLERQEELCRAIQRHRRAKAITDALLKEWEAKYKMEVAFIEEWSEEVGYRPDGTIADLAQRIHSALVSVMAEARMAALPVETEHKS
jgi:hypothetical protein